MGLKPVKTKDTWSTPLAGVLSQTIAAYYDQLPLKRPVEPVNKSTGALERSIINGLVAYASGVFTGTFSAAVSKELTAMGAKNHHGGWTIDPGLVPLKIVQLARRVDEKNAGWKAKIASALVKAVPATVVAAVALPAIYRALALRIASDISATTGRPTEVLPEYRDPINFQDEVESAVQDFSNKETRRIEAIMRKSEKEKWPVDRLEKTLTGRVGMTADRAKGMARQGVASAAIELKSELYQQIGLPRYRWATMKDNRVRADHADLDGKIFEWANPPITDWSTGYRSHPQQSSNCRCDAIPVED